MLLTRTSFAVLALVVSSAGDAAPKTAPVAPPLRVERGANMLPLYIPRAEELQFDVEIDIGISTLDVGDVELASGVEAYRAGLPSAGDAKAAAGAALERAWVRSVASGSYLSYRLENELKTRLLPQAFPGIYYTNSQRGSDNRTRELRIGVRDDVLVAEFRSDGHCKGCDNKEHFNAPAWLWSDPEHCKKCKKLEHRVWKTPVSRAIPAGTLDMLSAVYLARTLVKDNLDDVVFPVIDRQKVWEVTLLRGETKQVETEAGTFDCRLVTLKTKFLIEENEQEPEPNSSKFSGLFGIQGSIKIWMEKSSGVPVLIEGELPVPLPLVDKLDVRVLLKSYKGVPAEFKPVAK
jgi:hypothetical protein